MEKKKMLTLSLTHLTEETIETLNDEAVHEEAGWVQPKKFEFLKVYHKSDFGFFIMIDKHEYKKARIERVEIPADLHGLIAFAIELECDVICIEDHAEELLCLPSYCYNEEKQTNGYTHVFELCRFGGKTLSSRVVRQIPPKAYWQRMKVYPSEYICSECGELWPDKKVEECPNCHCKMDINREG